MNTFKAILMICFMLGASCSGSNYMNKQDGSSQAGYASQSAQNAPASPSTLFAGAQKPACGAPAVTTQLCSCVAVNAGQSQTSDSSTGSSQAASPVDESSSSAAAQSYAAPAAGSSNAFIAPAGAQSYAAPAQAQSAPAGAHQTSYAAPTVPASSGFGGASAGQGYSSAPAMNSGAQQGYASSQQSGDNRGQQKPAYAAAAPANGGY